jgi:outer membrane murein-binding lipoprotein Lpp
MSNAIPPPASGQVIVEKVAQLEQKVDALLRVVKAMKTEQERTNALIVQQQAAELAVRLREL